MRCTAPTAGHELACRHPPFLRPPPLDSKVLIRRFIDNIEPGWPHSHVAHWVRLPQQRACLVGKCFGGWCKVESLLQDGERARRDGWRGRNV
eukprot:scaffold44631_cov26-Tisochrysis_lutea.AAC.3